MAMIKLSLSLFLFFWTFTTSELKEAKQHFTLQPENKVDNATRYNNPNKHLCNSHKQFHVDNSLPSNAIGNIRLMFFVISQIKYLKYNFVAPEYLLI